MIVREGGNYPALNLSWEDAVFFCNQLSKNEKLSPCYEIKAIASAAPGDPQTIRVEFLPQGTGYRLPTEAEWEYACRAGTTTAYSFGDDKSKLERYAWYDANSKNNMPGEHQVGTKSPNPWGLHDMHGSVYEWCQDWVGDYDSSDVTDPTGPAQGTFRVFRGGCAGAADNCCRSAFRLGMHPTNRQYSFGMRVVRVADPQPAEQEPPKPIAKEPPRQPVPPPVAHNAPKPARDFKPDRMVTFQIYGLGHARQLAGQVYGKPIWNKAPCLDCIHEIFPLTPFDGLALNKVKGLISHRSEEQADPQPLTWTAEIDADNTDLGEIGKAILQANTPHRTAKQLYLELPARLNPNSAQTALPAIDKLKGVVQGGSKAVPRSADSRSEKILVRISGLESLTLADILAALKAVGIEVTLP